MTPTSWKWTPRPAVLGVALLAIPACQRGAGGSSKATGSGGAEPSSPGTAAAVTLKAPAPGPEPMRSIEANADKVARGKALFAACAACHGQDGRGRTGMGPDLNSESFLAAASDAFLLRTITNGRAGTTMIAWGKSLKKDDIEALVAYMRSWRKVQPATLDDSPLEGDVAEGEKIFKSICSGCHGRHGGGYQETANGTGIGRKAFLTAATNGYLRYIIKHGKTGSKMKGFTHGSKGHAVAELTDEQIDGVITYLRQQAW